MSSINMKKNRSDLLIFKSSGRELGAEMLVIGAAVDPKNPAESLDIMLIFEFIDSL